MKQNLKKVHLLNIWNQCDLLLYLTNFLIVNMLDMIDLQVLSTAEFTEKPD